MRMNGKKEVLGSRILLEGMEILLIRKRIKNMYLRVLPPEGEVQLTAPLRTSEAELSRFVAKHREWALHRQTELRSRKQELAQKYISGEIHFLWGKPYELRVRFGEGHGVFLKGPRMILTRAEMGTSMEREQQLNEWYRSQLKAAIEQRLPICEEITGKQASEWGVKNMKTRWGTCNTLKHRIWLNLQLAKKPPECLDYVILHELTHLYERHHNARFRAYMDEFCPGWRAVRERLNRHESSDGKMVLPSHREEGNS